jgi:DNA-binding HxlR family transcriptional regulator
MSKPMMVIPSSVKLLAYGECLAKGRDIIDCEKHQQHICKWRIFTEIKKLLASITSTMLSERLLKLEREGLVIKKIYSTVPPKVEYRG